LRSASLEAIKRRSLRLRQEAKTTAMLKAKGNSDCYARGARCLRQQKTIANAQGPLCLRQQMVCHSGLLARRSFGGAGIFPMVPKKNSRQAEILNQVQDDRPGEIDAQL
jgi:hypothetical protein